MPTLPTSTASGAQPTNTSPPRVANLRRPFFEKIGHQLRNLPKTSRRTILPTIAQNEPARLGSLRQLRNLHLLSPMFFQSHFLNWTTSTLQTSSRTLTEVSFKTDRVPPSTWHDLLSQVTLPSLSKLQVTCDSIIEQRTVEFDDMLKFLIRHPSIVNLDLYGLPAPTNSRRPRGLLPSLQMLASYPELVIWLLNCEGPLFRSILFRCGKAHEHHFKHLISLNVVSEVYRLPAAFNYDTFDNVLALLPHSTPSLTTLAFSFFSLPGVAEWFDKRISRGPLAALERVTSLEVVSPWSWEEVVMDRIPLFLGLFLGLRDFIYPAHPADLDMATVETFLKDIAQNCPRMRKITIGRVERVDLDSLREV